MKFKNTGPLFALISTDALLSAEFDALSRSAIKLLLYLHGICYGGPSEIRPYDVSQHLLSTTLKCSQKTVSRSVKELEHAGFLEVVRETDGFRRRKINVYTLTGKSLPYHRTNLSGSGNQKRTSLSDFRGTSLSPTQGTSLSPIQTNTDYYTDVYTNPISEMTEKENDLYTLLIEHLIEEYGYQDISIWLKSSTLKMDGNTSTLRCITPEHCGWVVENFLPGITSFLAAQGLSEQVEITARGLPRRDAP